MQHMESKRGKKKKTEKRTTNNKGVLGSQTKKLSLILVILVIAETNLFALIISKFSYPGRASKHQTTPGGMWNEILLATANLERLEVNFQVEIKTTN